MLNEYFSVIGLSQREVEVYLALLELGKAPAALVARQTAIKRSTVYTVLQTLISRGLVSEEASKDSALFLANSVEAISRMVERDAEVQSRELAAKQRCAEMLTEMLGPYFASSVYSVPTIQFFEGASQVEDMLWQYSTEWQSSISQQDYIWWGYQDHQFVEQYRGWLDHYWARLHEDERIKLLTNQSEVEQNLERKVLRREVKTVPTGFEFSSTIWVLGDFVVTIMTRQSPHFAFQLKDAVFAANQRNVFKLLWQSLQPRVVD